jgi:hypothetical protein
MILTENDWKTISERVVNRINESMSRDDIMRAVERLSRSQGKYGRLLQFLNSGSEDAELVLQDLEDQCFPDVVSMVMYIEESKKATKGQQLTEASTIDVNQGIWDEYDIPWNEVDDEPERYNGIWYISVEFFDYTAFLGEIDIDRQFGTLKDCLDFAQTIDREMIFDICNEEISDEGFTSISLNINCQEERATYEVANTKLFVPNK